MTPPTETPPATLSPGRTRPSARGFLGWLMAPQRRGPLLIAPAIATLVIVNIFPLMWSYGLSFFHYNAKRIAVPPQWRGFGNYVDLLSDSDVWGRFQNTAVIVIGSVAVQLVVGFLLALLFSREFPLRRYLLMLVLAPMMLSLSAVGVFFKLFYEPTLGFIPRLVQEFTGQPFVILDTPVKANIAIICADAWMWSPFVMLLVLAGLVSVPEISLRGRGDRPRQRLAALPHHHLPLYPQPAAAGAAVPHHRDVQDLRRPLRADRGRAGHVHGDHLGLPVPRRLQLFPDRPRLGARLYRAVRRDRADQPLSLRNPGPSRDGGTQPMTVRRT